MHKLFYCLDCKRVFKNEEACQYCNSINVKDIKKNTPINVLGTKQKGRVMKVLDGGAKVILVNEANEQLIKEFKAEELKKVL